MAQFAPEQHEYIENTIQLAIVQQSDRVGTILAEGKTMQDNMAAIIEKHNTELHQNSDRVTRLVDDANKANLELSGFTDKINEAERIMAKFLSDLQVFEANQVSVFASQKTQVDHLSSETETALTGLGGKLTAAVAAARQDVIDKFVAQLDGRREGGDWSPASRQWRR